MKGKDNLDYGKRLKKTLIEDVQPVILEIEDSVHEIKREIKRSAEDRITIRIDDIRAIKGSEGGDINGKEERRD